MKKLTILLVVVSLILSGCVDKIKTDIKTNNDDKGTSNKSTVENVNIEDSASNIDIVTDNIEIATDNEGASEDVGNNVSVKPDISSGWCVAGDIVTIQTSRGQEEYTIIGITTYQERQVCQAEQIYENGKKVRYFSKDGKFVSESAVSSSKSGNASAYSDVVVSGSK